MKDLLNKMTELQGTQASTEVVSTTGKKVLTESKTEVKESKPTLKGIFNSMLNENDQITIQPAKQNTQVIKQGQKTLGTVENPQLANQIKQSIGKGEMTLAGDELNEVEDEIDESMKIYQVPVIGNFWSGKYYVQGIDSVHVLASSSEEAKKIAQDNLDQVKEHFLNKKYPHGNMGGTKPALRRDNPGPIRIGASNPKPTTMTQYSKTLTIQGSFIPVDLNQHKELNEVEVNETDMGQADARKSAPSSKEEQEKVFSRTREKSRNLRAELDADPELLTKKVSESVINEKAVSKSQQQAAGAALAAKRGDAPKSKLKGASKEMAKMSTKELEKFAKTKHKGLPDKKEKTNESYVMEKKTVLVRSGLLELEYNDKTNTVNIVYQGNMGSSEKRNIEPEIDKVCGHGCFAKMRKLGTFYNDGRNIHNDPSYSYILQIPLDVFVSLTGDKFPSLAKRSAKKKEKTDEAALPTHDGDFGAGLGAGRNSKTLESKKAKPDYIDLDKDGNKKESMKKAAADKQKVSTMKKTNEAKAKPDYIDLDKDGNKTEPMKKAAADKKKKAVKEGANPTEAARLLGKAHALGKDPFACKYEQGSPEAQAYLDGYKEGLDECYGSGGGMGMSQDMTQDIGMMPGMDSMVSMTDTQSPRGGSEFEIDSMDDVGGFGGFDDQPDEADMMAFEAWDRQLNELLNESKMKDIDTDMQELSDAAFKKAHGKTKAEMEKSLSGATDKKDKKPVKEGISVSVSKGQQGAPDSVSVTAQDGDADALLAMIKQAGLGLFGGEEQSGYGAPTTPQMPTNGAGDIGDHDSMMSLIKKMTTGSNDYEDEESQDDQHVHGHPDAACDVCGSSDCGCDDESDSKALVVGEEETEDQMEFEVAEANAPDSDQAETTADENAEAEEDKALAGADSDKEEEIDEGSCSDEEEELTEWANDAGYEGSENTKDNTFEEDIDFMTRVISGGLNGPKKDQTTLPHTKVTVDDVSESILDWKKLSGIK